MANMASDGFKGYVNAVMENFNRTVDGLEFRNYGVYPHIRHVLNSGKKIRPIMTALSYQVVGGRNMQKIMPLAVIIELVHNATLVHDDIIDSDEIRRGEVAAHKNWGRDNAIIIGDAMIAIAVNMVADYGKETTKLLSRYGFELCEGEILDVSLSLENCNEELYLEKIMKKSVSLFKASTEGGAIAGNGPRKEILSLARFGENLGVAYQIADDLSDLINPASSDLRNGTVTLPLIHMYENSGKKTKAMIDKNFGRNATKTFTRIIHKEIEKTNSIEYCEKKIIENIENARKNIRNLKKSKFRDYLIKLPDFILSHNLPAIS